MKTYIKKNLSEIEYKRLLKRPAINFTETFQVVEEILKDVKKNGIKAAKKYAKKFDAFENKDIFVAASEIEKAELKISEKLKESLIIAKQNIERFHKQQKSSTFEIETMPGVKCSREVRAIENVGLYIPGGTAILPSTILMLAIPAKIAGCERIVLITPVKNRIDPILLYTASLVGVKEILKIGGAQGIALAGYGCEELKKVDKVFGPGNQYVTAAKILLGIDPDGCSFDMPAGPSEVLVIADKKANPKFIAADLLSQAEHGIDSQAILVTDSEKLVENVLMQIEKQLKKIPRNKIAAQALNNSFNLVVENIDEAIEFSNKYAPEHLILNIENENNLIKKIKNAGSVFLGRYSPESVGDYASGTNHSLPTYGYAKTYSGVRVEDFQKTITFQKLTKEGLKNISETVINIAEIEKLDAHAKAVKIRISENEY